MSGHDEADRRSPSPPDRVGARLGPYRLLSEIGTGGMGTVYLGRVEADDALLPHGYEVAIKVIHAHLPTRPGFLPRFEREVEAGRRIRHPNVVPTHGMGADDVDGNVALYLSMDYVEGRTLRELLTDLGRVPETLIRELALQIASGLTAIHAAGIVHRDLKPENVLVTDDHEVRISDLGVVQLLEESQDVSGAGRFAGSILYAAPEQFKNERVHPTADLYSLGVLLYELATGDNPFRHDTMMAVMHAHLNDAPLKLTEADPSISPFLSELVGQLLAKDPSLRFSSAAQLVEVLDEGEEAEWWIERQREQGTVTARRPRIPVQRDTRLHGRKDAIDLLQAGWQEALQGRGGTRLVVGEPGIGKTRLADAFIETLGSEDAHILYGSYAPATGAGGLSEALRQHFGEASLTEAVAEYLPSTPALVAALSATSSAYSGPIEGNPLGLDAVQAALVQLVRAMAAEQPVLWVLDDLDRAPTESQQVVLALARALEGHRVLLLVTSTPSIPPEMRTIFGRLPGFQRIDLGRLSPREVVELLQDAFRSEVLAERLGVKVALKSDGVPFYVFEMIRGLTDGQFIERHPDGTFTQSRLVDDLDTPSVVRDLIKLRLRDLSKDERALLDAAAVLGFEFDADLLAMVLEHKRVAVLQDLADLERRLGLVRAAGRLYRFDHPQIVDVIYEDLAPLLRAAYHSLLADAYARRAGLEDTDARPSPRDAAFLAYHYVRGTNPAAAGPYIEVALEHLQGTYRHEAALTLARSALAARDVLKGRQRAETCLTAAKQLETLGRWVEEREMLAEGVACAEGLGDAPLLGRFQHCIGRHHARRAEWEEALQAYDEALAHARVARDVAIECQAECGRGEVLTSKIQLDDAEVHFQRALSLATATNDATGEWSARSGLARVASRHGHPEEAARGFRKAMALAQGIGDVRSIASSASALGNALVFLGQYDEAQELHEKAVERLHQIGDRIGEAYMLGSLGNVHTRKGRFQEACACQQRVIDIAREVGDRRAESTGIANQGMAYLHLDRLDDARRRFQQYLEIGRRLSSQGGGAWAHARLGDVDLKSDDPQSAHAHFEEALPLARKAGNRWAEGLAIGNLGVALLGMGRLDEAEKRLRESLLISRELADRQGEGAAESDLGTLYMTAGRFDEAKARFESCLAISEDIGDKRGEAFSREGLGRILFQQGHIEEARAQLSRARDIATEIGGRRRDAWITLVLTELAVAAERIPHAERLARQVEATGRSVRSPSLLTLALARLALLPGGDTRAAGDTYRTHAERLPLLHRMEAAYLLWQGTGDAQLLQHARDALDTLAAHAPAGCPLTTDAVPLYRNIRAAEA